MAEVVERLKLSKMRSEDENYQHGMADGRRWAERAAEAAHLERLEADVEAHRGHHTHPFADEIQSAYSPGERFVFTIYPEHFGDRDEANVFWSGFFFNEQGDNWKSEMMSNPSYVSGFADGALEVWDGVKDEL